MDRKLLLAAQAVLLVLVGTAVGAGAGQVAPVHRSLGLSVMPESPLTLVGTGFTYQGRLLDGGLASGSYDFTFKLFDAASGGNQVGTTINQASQLVAGGLFTVTLDFGNTAFLGDARYLEIAVAEAGGSLTTLTPRQPLSPSPYAMSAPWFGVSGKPTGYNPLRSANSFASVQSGNVGQHSSVTIGADGLPLISYYYATGADLRVVHCNDPACSAAGGYTITPLDTGGNVGQYTSITIGADGLGLISYYDATGQRLKVAHCSNAACTSATITPFDSGGNVGQYTSVTIGSDGLGLISYYDVTYGDLKVAHCGNVTCTLAARTLSTLDSGGVVGQYTSVAVGADGLPVISYYDATAGDLWVAHCTNQTCSSSTLALIDNSANDVGQHSSVAIGADGLPLISYYNSTLGDLRVAHCADVACATSPTITALDTPGDVGRYTSVVLGIDGLGLISYYDATGGNLNLKVAHCADQTCSSATSVTVDNSANDVGQYSSITIGVDGLPLISYYDLSTTALKALRCASATCEQYQRRR